MSPIAATNPETAQRFFAVDEVIVQLKEVRGLPIGKSTFLRRVKAGKYPQPIRVSPSRPVWTQADIDTLIAAL